MWELYAMMLFIYLFVHFVICRLKVRCGDRQECHICFQPREKFIPREKLPVNPPPVNLPRVKFMPAAAAYS